MVYHTTAPLRAIIMVQLQCTYYYVSFHRDAFSSLFVTMGYVDCRKMRATIKSENIITYLAPGIILILFCKVYVSYECI